MDALRQSPRNKKATGPYFHVYIKSPTNFSGGEKLLSPEQAEVWNRDPDEFARKELGFISKDEYHEYLELRGAALCGQLTKKGKLCKCGLHYYQLEPPEWRKVHRIEYCKRHEVVS